MIVNNMFTTLSGSYELINDPKLIKTWTNEISEMMNKVCRRINNEGRIKVQFFYVGSGKRNMMTYLAYANYYKLDLDVNIVIMKKIDKSLTLRGIKDYINEILNESLRRKYWYFEKNSSAVLTYRKQYSGLVILNSFNLDSIDIAIVKKNKKGQWMRLIRHQQNPFLVTDLDYNWQLAPNSEKLREKEDELKKNNHWQEVRECYLDKKNLHINDKENHPSFNCYIEAVNEVYYKYFG